MTQDDEREDTPEWFAHLEPKAAMFWRAAQLSHDGDRDLALLSIAISMKRLADAFIRAAAV
jgi:hypothetical protein